MDSDGQQFFHFCLVEKWTLCTSYLISRVVLSVRETREKFILSFYPPTLFFLSFFFISLIFFYTKYFSNFNLLVATGLQPTREKMQWLTSLKFGSSYWKKVTEFGAILAINGAIYKENALAIALSSFPIPCTLFLDWIPCSLSCHQNPSLNWKWSCHMSLKWNMIIRRRTYYKQQMKKLLEKFWK